MNNHDEEIRDRKRQIRVIVNAKEREIIYLKAAAANLSVSAYLRELGVGHKPKSILDNVVALDLLKINGDLGRLGGLLKFWLAEKEGQGASPGEVRAVLKMIEANQDALLEAIKGVRLK